MEKSVVTANFIKRGWTSATSDEEWNFYWYVPAVYIVISLWLIFQINTRRIMKGRTLKPVAVCSRPKVLTVWEIISKNNFFPLKSKNVFHPSYLTSFQNDQSFPQSLRTYQERSYG